jgi:hypothetical protein
VYYWIKQTFKPGDKAIAIAKSLEGYQGLEPKMVAGMAMAASAKALTKFLGILESADFSELGDDPKVLSQLVALLPSMLRECRSSAQNYNALTAPDNQLDSILSGANAVAEELKITFKDSAFESALIEALAGALLKIEGK